MINKAGRIHGKSQTAWERWNWLLLAEIFPVLIHSPSPKQLPASSEAFRRLFYFLCDVLPSCFYTLSYGGSCKDDTGTCQWKVTLWEGLRGIKLVHANRLIINGIKSWNKHSQPVLCLDPKDTLAHSSCKLGCQDISQTGWLWQALSITQEAQREMLLF